MKTFLVIFTCAENSKNHQAWNKLDPQMQKERAQNGAKALQEWSAKYGKQVTFDGGSLGEKTKAVDSEGIRDVPSQMGAFLVIQANSHKEAAEMFLEHPHFACFPGDGVLILERAPRD